MAAVCCICNAPVAESATALDIPFVKQKPFLCPTHEGDMKRAGGSVLGFLAMCGVTPGAVGRVIKSSRGVEQIVDAIRGRAEEPKP